MTTAVESAFDIALWFADTALEQNEYLQPQKLHRLLFLSQAYYSVAYNGQKLMPAVFVAEEMGPVEPNVYKAFHKGRPNIDAELFLDEDVENFLDNLWRRFGHHSPDRLTRMCKETLAYKQAVKKGSRTEIPLRAMQLSFARAEDTPSLQQVLKPKLMRSQTGRPVAVKRWTPGVSSGSKN
ncbi:MAG: type II toxin-antitoxin system antitoxin SocA domain-containing protein [Alphaproteobacteria bacterium]